MDSNNLKNLIAYLCGSTDNKDDYKVTYKHKEDGTVTIRVKLKSRIFVYEGFHTEDQADVHTYRQILLTGVDMLMDNDLWYQYTDKLKDKFKDKDNG